MNETHWTKRIELWLLKFKYGKVIFISTAIAILAVFAYNVLTTTMMEPRVRPLRMISSVEIRLLKPREDMHIFIRRDVPNKTNMFCDENACINRTTIIQAQKSLLQTYHDKIPFICTSMLNIDINCSLPSGCTIINRKTNGTLFGYSFAWIRQSVIKTDYSVYSPYFKRTFNGTVYHSISVTSSAYSTSSILLDGEDSVWFFILKNLLDESNRNFTIYI